MTRRSAHSAAIMLLGALALLCAGTLSASAEQDSFYPPQPGPAAAVSALSALAGNWTCTGKLAAGAIVPGAPATTYQSTIKIAPIHQGHAYALAYEQKFADNSVVFSGTWYAAWDDIKKSLAFYWLDNMGTIGRETSDGLIKDKLTLSGEGSMPAAPGAGGATSRRALLRDTFTRMGESKMHWKGEIKPDGASAWSVVGDDDCRKE